MEGIHRQRQSTGGGCDGMDRKTDPENQRQLPPFQLELAGGLGVIAILIGQDIDREGEVHAVIFQLGAIVGDAHADGHTVFAFAAEGEKVGIDHYAEVEGHGVGVHVPDLGIDILERGAEGEPLRQAAGVGEGHRQIRSVEQLACAVLIIHSSHRHVAVSDLIDSEGEGADPRQGQSDAGVGGVDIDQPGLDRELGLALGHEGQAGRIPVGRGEVIGDTDVGVAHGGAGAAVPDLEKVGGGGADAVGLLRQKGAGAEQHGQQNNDRFFDWHIIYLVYVLRSAPRGALQPPDPVPGIRRRALLFDHRKFAHEFVARQL